MKKTMSAAIAIALATLAATTASADDGEPEPSTEELCARTRPKRVELAKRDVQAWLARVKAIKAACTLRTVHTGAFIVDGNRIAPETQWRATCPKGPPPGEDLESVTSVLSVFDPGVTICVGSGVEGEEDRCDSPSGEGDLVHLQRACRPSDKSQGLPTLLPALNEMPALRAVLAIPAPKPAPKKK